MTQLKSLVAEFLDVTALREEQRKDSGLAAMLQYLQDGTLPQDEKLAKRMMSESK